MFGDKTINSKSKQFDLRAMSSVSLTELWRATYYGRLLRHENTDKRNVDSEDDPLVWQSIVDATERLDQWMSNDLKLKIHNPFDEDDFGELYSITSEGVEQVQNELGLTREYVHEGRKNSRSANKDEPRVLDKGVPWWNDTSFRLPDKAINLHRWDEINRPIDLTFSDLWVEPKDATAANMGVFNEIYWPARQVKSADDVVLFTAVNNEWRQRNLTRIQFGTEYKPSLNERRVKVVGDYLRSLGLDETKFSVIPKSTDTSMKAIYGAVKDEDAFCKNGKPGSEIMLERFEDWWHKESPFKIEVRKSE